MAKKINMLSIKTVTIGLSIKAYEHVEYLIKSVVYKIKKKISINFPWTVEGNS